MLEIDGAQGEGGGQILRTALSLSLATGQPFRITNIRAQRVPPGLRPQHLTAIGAAATVGQAEIGGAVAGSRELVFRPGDVRAGEYRFTTGTAGSALLVLQTVLPALLTADNPSALVIEGGTHNPLAPPFEFVAAAWLPLLAQLGPVVRAKLDRPGFYPEGGGKVRVTIEPAAKLERLDLPERGGVRRCTATVLLADLPRHIAERELTVLKRKLPIDCQRLAVAEYPRRGPGNAVVVTIECAQVTEVFTGFGEQGVRAEMVADRTARAVRQWLDAEVPVGVHLADQLLLPLALAGGGSFVTMPLSGHATTNIEVIRQFLPVAVRTLPAGEHGVRVEIGRQEPAAG
ncbi:RNA 3'-terminal phosphate cyclase [bacterium]|nr:RNA 3'-terminal phosphate cyclase [bacterium]